MENEKTTTQMKAQDIMWFFSEFKFAEKELKELFKSFEKENNSTSIFDVTEEQIERTRQLLLTKVIENNKALAQIPREFLEEHFLRFTPKQMNDLRKLAEKHARDNETSDYRMYTPEQQIEGKLLIEQAIRDNLNSYLHMDNASNQHNLSEILAKVRKLQEDAIQHNEYVKQQREVITNAVNNIRESYKQLVTPFVHSDVHEILAKQNAQILALSNEISILKSINSQAMKKIEKLKSRLNEAEKE